MSTAPPSPEWLALLAGVKPGLRSWRDPARAAAEAAAAVRRGFAVASRPVPGDAGVITYVARTPAAAQRLCAHEATIVPRQAPRPITAAQLDAHRALGAALGYPPCCVEAFVARVARGVTVLAAGGAAHEDFVAASEAAARSSRFDARCNGFAADRTSGWLSHVPCRFDCAPSVAYAEAVQVAYAAHDAAAAAVIAARLAIDVAIERDGRRVAAAAAGPDACRLGFGEGP